MAAFVISGCGVDVQGPQYTQESVLTTLKEYGVTAHYPRAQGDAQLLATATGERHLLQIDYIDHYEVKGGWAEVYFYPDAETAYREAMLVRNEFQKRVKHDAKVASLQGKDIEVRSLPLFQHGNVLLYGLGIADDEEAMERITETFGELKY